MSARRVLCCAVLLTFASSSWAATPERDDAPIPFDDDQPKDDEVAPKPRKKKKAKPVASDESLAEDDQKEKDAEETSLTHLDDPNIGLSVEVALGAMLFDAARGGVDPRFMVGGRITWEWARLIPDEYLREMFFADVTYLWSATQDGTRQINATTNHHFFTFAPAVGYPFQKVPGMVYAQVGAGLDYNTEQVVIGEQKASISGTKFLFQYGIGLRFRPALIESEAVRLSFRFELTRFIRGYMHDMLLGGSVGVTF